MARRLICASTALAERGEGVRFEAGGEAPARQAFAVRFGGRVYAYLNECPHARTELDWEPGRFFDISGDYLICATHGAIYDPSTGRCVCGPCKGRSLAPLMTIEMDGQVYLDQG